MEDFSSWDAPQWSNIHQHTGLTISPAPESNSSILILDPIHELQEYHQHSGGVAIPWGEGAHVPSSSSSSLLMINQPNNSCDLILPLMMTPHSGLMGKHGAQYQHFDGSGSSSGSMDPQPECLTNSNTAETTPTSVEDDGISVIFSDCKNMPWNLCSRDNNSKNNPKRKVVNSTEPTRCLRVVGSVEDSNPGGRGPNKGRKRIKYNGSSNICFGSASASASLDQLNAEAEPDPEVIQQMKEMIYIAAAFRPVNLGIEVAERPKRKNVKISCDPQTMAARQRRERISERLRVLQKLVPGGGKMDTASMLDEAANYLKFLSKQVKALEAFNGNYSNGQYYPPINLQFSPMPLIPMQQDLETSYSKP